MKLETYLVIHQASPAFFAKIVGCSPEDIRNILKGRQPSHSIAQAINRVTNGSVSTEELVYGPGSGPIGLQPIREEIERRKKRKRRI